MIYFRASAAFSLGLERTGGFETVAFCEIEPFPRTVLAKHWPEVPCYEDVRTLTAGKLAADGIYPDVIVGGFPCQDLSTSGSRKGLDGERSGLWYEFARLISEVRPKFVIVENSPELLDGWIGDVLGPLAALGFDAEWHCIPASHVGAPHGRDRVWIIAYPAGKRQPRQRELAVALRSTADAYRQAGGLERAFHEGTVPYVCGGHDGVPSYVDEAALAGLGNAVVPQIPEMIGHALLKAAL